MKATETTAFTSKIGEKIEWDYVKNTMPTSINITRAILEAPFERIKIKAFKLLL